MRRSENRPPLPHGRGSLRRWTKNRDRKEAGLTLAVLTFLFLTASAMAQTRVVTLPTKSPLVTIRIVFIAGSALDPPDRPGTAYLTAMMLAHGGTQEFTYRQVVDAMFPMAASINVQVDKEMVTFSGATSPSSAVTRSSVL